MLVIITDPDPKPVTKAQWLLAFSAVQTQFIAAGEMRLAAVCAKVVTHILEQPC